jgi:hypothetical protein
VVIRASDTELDITGEPAELRAVGAALAALKPGASVAFEADTAADPYPYTRVLVALRAEASGGLVRVAVEGDVLTATGSPDLLRRFASFFEFADDTPKGHHQHHEWWEGNEDIAPDSRPLVISRA